MKASGSDPTETVRTSIQPAAGVLSIKIHKTSNPLGQHHVNTIRIYVRMQGVITGRHVDWVCLVIGTLLRACACENQAADGWGRAARPAGRMTTARGAGVTTKICYLRWRSYLRLASPFDRQGWRQSARGKIDAHDSFCTGGRETGQGGEQEEKGRVC